MLLRPSPELTDIILGIIGKAQELYGMTIHAFGFFEHSRAFLGRAQRGASVARGTPNRILARPLVA